jgi:sugar phosphate isomerase/epimerase
MTQTARSTPEAVPLSLSYYTVPELSAAATIDVAAACGCRLVGVRLLGGQPSGELPPIMTEPAARREILHRLRDTGVEVLDASTARLVPETVIAEYGRFLDVAAELGAKHVLASGNDPDGSRLTNNFRQLCDAAAGLGMTVDVEFVPWMSLANLGAATRLIEVVGRANLGIVVDALHFKRSGSALAELAAVPADRLRYMQICDAPATSSADPAALLHEATRERLFPGEGELDLVGLLRTLPRGIPLALEIPTTRLAETLDAQTRVARAVAATRRVLAAAFAAG